MRPSPMHAAMATPIFDDTFPPSEALPRAVLVRNISPAATAAALEDLFSFCGTIEAHRLRNVRLAPDADPTQQAIVIFTDETARAGALEMDQSSIVDSVVTVSAVPDAFDFDNDPPPFSDARASAPQQPSSFLGGSFQAFGDLFSGVGTAVAAEVEKASKVIDSATDTGVLKAAKDQVILARQKTRELAVDIDEKYQVSRNVRTVAEVSKTTVSNAATVVATQTASLANQVDKGLHISENTEKLAEAARENASGGIRAVSGGFQSLLAQTGLQQNSDASATTASAPAAQAPPASETAAPQTRPVQ